MPGLNWDAFSKLPGSMEANFEALCRGLIKRHYGQFGQFAALAAQPGVEFHLKLDQSCSLGKPGRWFGWQCRWYDLPGGRALGNARRLKIMEAIDKTHKDLPQLTDWVLWTRRPLTRGDQRWFYSLRTKMRRHLWTEQDVDQHMLGPGEVFRSTYFGGLVATPAGLSHMREMAIGPIRSRWMHEVHQVTEAQRLIEEILGHSTVWGHLQYEAQLLTSLSTRLSNVSSTVPPATAGTVAKMISVLDGAQLRLMRLHQLGSAGELELVTEELKIDHVSCDLDMRRLPSKLRGANHVAALFAANALGELEDIPTLLRQIRNSLSTGLVAVVAEAGCGKTQLAAEMTASSGSRPCGVFLHGRNLAVGDDLNSLANRVTISGLPCPSMELLLACVDAAGRRSRSRLAITIDGLNEAEDPRCWKAILAQVDVLVRDFPFVLVVCTIRGAFVGEALPENVPRVEIPDFGADTEEAIGRYFVHYRIDVGDSELPFDLLKHPLTLRIFCEVTNPKRGRNVGIESVPASITALFDRYVDQVSERVAELSSPTNRYFEQDVRCALDKIGLTLWDKQGRAIEVSELRRLLGDASRTWDRSLVRALEQEGILLKFPRHEPNGFVYSPSYDALGGHLIASAILSKEGNSGFGAWVSDPFTLSALSGPDSRHPLADDVFRSLIALLPRRLHRQQLWMLLNEPLRARALTGAARLEGAYLDSATVDALRDMALKNLDWARSLFSRLFETRRILGHPLNSRFMHDILSGMDLPDRDLSWTEWVRRNAKSLLQDIGRAERKWRASMHQRSKEEILLARWIMWLLTSTAPEVRNAATRALYWFGWKSPLGLFRLTLQSLRLNDPNIMERMLGASYGLCMALHRRTVRNRFRTEYLPSFAKTLYRWIFAQDAPFGTTHIIARDYARRVVDIASLHSQKLFSVEELSYAKPPFRQMAPITWQEMDDPDDRLYRDGNSPLGMDFANYTIGGLVKGRANYDSEHPEFKSLIRKINWRVRNLGFRLKRFGSIDAELSAQRYRRWESPIQFERYGKKYARIAYFEQYGIRADAGLLDDEWRDETEKPGECDIDPSFPDSPIRLSLAGDFLGDRASDVGDWVRSAAKSDFSHLLVQSKLANQSGPWILLDGSCMQMDKKAERHGFVKLQSFVLSNANLETFIRLIGKERARGRWMPDIPTDNRTFMGEVPWCSTFPYSEWENVDFVVGKKRVRIKPDDPRRVFANSFAEFSWREGATSRLPTFEMVNIVEEVPVYIPARMNNFATNPGSEHQAGAVPAKEWMEFFGLRLDLPSWNSRDDNDKLHSITTYRGDFPNGEHYLYFLKKSADDLLEAKNLALAWVIWGERQHYSERHSSGSKQSHGYKYFQRAYVYRNGRIKLLKAEVEQT